MAGNLQNLAVQPNHATVLHSSLYDEPLCMHACQVMSDVLETVEARILLVMPSLAPALASNLGSTNERVRSSAAAAMDVLVQVVPPGLLVQSLSHIVMHSSNVRGKYVLVDKLAGVVPQVREITKNEACLRHGRLELYSNAQQECARHVCAGENVSNAGA